MATTAALLLQRIGKDERVGLIRDVTKSAKLDSASDVSFATSMLSECPDDEAEFELIKRLKANIDKGMLGDWIFEIEDHERILSSLLSLSCSTLKESVDSLASLPRSQGITVPMTLDHGNVKMHPGRHYPDSGDHSVAQAATSNLRFLRKVLTECKAGQMKVASDLDVTILSLMGASDLVLSRAATDVCFCVLQTIGSKSTLSIWTRVASLAASIHFPSHSIIGYQLWLRALANGWLNSLITVDQTLYWKLISDGLQHRDAERRKLCLQILRLSVDKGMQPTDTRKCDASEDPGAVLRQQYGRYCLVFETVILGRYLNQIQECRRDMEALVSEKSIVGAPWIEALLNSAMDPVMQESNRRYIGQWMMSFNLPFVRMPTTATNIFKNSFLPWATLGASFTSSLREIDGHTECPYGEQLANYLCALLTDKNHSQEVVHLILGAIMDYLKDFQDALFAPATVFVFEGLSRSFDTRQDLWLTADEFNVLSELSFWARYPEIARSFIGTCVCDIFKLSLERSYTTEANLRPAAKLRWQSIQDPLQSLSEDRSDPMPFRSTSGRAAKEQDAISRVRVFERDLLDKENLPTSDEVLTGLQEVVEDMEYLEYPKSMLLLVVPITFHTKVLRNAQGDQNGALAQLIVSLVRRFQTICENRIFLFTPFMTGLRSALLEDPRLTALLPIEDILVRVAEFPPRPKVDLLLEDVTAQLIAKRTSGKLTFEYYYGKTHAIGFAAFYDLCSRLGHLDPMAPRSIIDRLMKRWLNQKPPTPTFCKWKTTVQLQVVFLCSEQILTSRNTLQVRELFEMYQKVLNMEELPRLRHLLEWCIARIVVIQKSLRDHVLEMLVSKDHHSNPKYLASLMKIAVCASCSKVCGEQFALEVANALVVLSASSKVVIRHESQWSFPRLIDHAREMNWKSITENTAFVALSDYIRSLSNWNDPPLYRQLDRLDLDEHHTMTNLVQGGYIALQPVERPLISHTDFVHLYADDPPDLDRVYTPSMTLGSPIVTKAEEAIAISAEKGSHLRQIPTFQESSEAISAETALQTKGTAYLTTASDGNFDNEVMRRSDLIVVASLIDNPYNLGGLSRASEIFGASALYLQDPRVASNRLFTSVSVSSHLHLPILPLATTDLPAFLAGKRGDGWSIVGIEQTDRSVILGTDRCQLPEKTILVLGSESTGIPAIIMSECDVLVEIPQQGLTRSLNVQTAAGIVLFEYARQHRDKRKSS